MLYEKFPKIKKRPRRSKSEMAEEKSTEARKELLRKGPCQSCGNQIRCDVEHIKTRGAGGTDDEWNLWSACRSCHIIKGARGISYLAGISERFKNALTTKGWRFCPVKQKWTRDL